MTVNYTSLLGLALPVTGTEAGAWGDVVNNYLTSYLDASVAGTQTITGSQTAVTLAVTNGATLVTVGSGATGSAQFQIITCTGNPASLLTITAPASSRQYIIINSTSTSQSVKIVGAGPTTGVTIVSGEKAHVAWNGSDFVKIATQNGNGDFVTVDTTNLEVTNIKAKDGTASMTLADSTGVVTFSANPVLNAGTANGVPYLSSPGKVLTTGSALTFDGSLLKLGSGVGLSVQGVAFPASGSGIEIFWDGTQSVAQSYSRTSLVYLPLWLESSYTRFGIAGSEAMRLTTTGLGIGTSSPAYKLDVRGVTASGNGTITTGFSWDTGGLVGTFSNHALGILTNGNVVAKFDTSGNLGLGVTPSAWAAGWNAQQIGYSYGLMASSSVNAWYQLNNSYFDGSFKYKNNGVASSYEQGTVPHVWKIAPSGTAGNAISFTQAMTLDASGNLIVGATSTSYRMEVVAPSGDNITALFRSGDATAANNAGGGFRSISSATAASRVAQVWLDADGANLSGGDYFYIQKNGNSGTVDIVQYSNSAMTFATNATERARIDSSGNLGLGVTPSAWRTSEYKAVQVGNGASFYGRVTAGDEDKAGFSANAFFDQTDNRWEYIATDSASRYDQIGGGHYWFIAPSGTANTAITFTQAMTLDASGNLGIGQTNPSTWLVNGLGIGSGANDWGATIYTGTASTGYLCFADGATGLDRYRGYISYAHATNAMVFATDAAERARITSGGEFIVGNTSAAGSSQITAYGAANGQIAVQNSTNWSRLLQNSSDLYIDNGVGGSAGNIIFRNSSSTVERARITSAGYFKASNAGTYYNSGGSQHELRNSVADADLAIFTHTSATNPYGVYLQFTAASPDNNTNYFLTCADSTTNRCIIYSDGDLANHDGVYGTISDQKLKQDIVDAGSQWNDIKAIRFRKYRMKSDVAANPDAPALLGVVAQELEQVSPGLVDEHPDMETVEVTDEDGNVTQTQQPTGTTTKTVKSSILLMKAAVALQEAMARIEKLEAEVAELKGA